MVPMTAPFADLLSIPPWEALLYFNQISPVSKSVATTQPATKLCSYNPQRWGLLFGNVSAGSVNVAPATPGLAAGQGLTQIVANSQLTITYPLYSVLTCYDWYGITSVGGASIFVIEMVLANKWPLLGDDSPLVPIVNGIVQPGEQLPSTVPPAPAVNGRQSVMDYWRSLISRIKGG